MVNYRYDLEVRHHRAAPATHDVRQRVVQWYVDVDEPNLLPRGLRWMAGIESRDHLGDADKTLRDNIETYLRQQGIDLRGGRIRLLTGARMLGYLFNPLSLFWCYNEDEELTCVLAEVHNTYGGRHVYLLRPDSAGRAETEKAFFVSPFYPVDGFYRMSVPAPGPQLAVTITLHRAVEAPFVASLRGRRHPITTRDTLAFVLRNPLASRAVRAQITKHGIWLYLKGLPVRQRPKQPIDPVVGRPGRSHQEAAMPPVPSIADRLAGLVRSAAGVDLPVRLRAWDGSESGPVGGPMLVIRSRRALRRLVWSPGELGLARGYVTGDLEVEGDVTESLRQVWAMARTRPATPATLSSRQRWAAVADVARFGGIGWAPKPPRSEARLTGRRHTRSRDRAAIAHHYDLSNEFYQLLLDPNMAYSSAYYAEPDMTLEQAQRAKLDLICRKLGLGNGQRLLDVGCGWGSLIVHAAQHYGVQATGITLSTQQRDFIDKHIAERGLADLVTVRLQDYREIGDAEHYDAISSIEMGEHVGEDNYPTYAAALLRNLKPTGRLLLQQMSRRGDAAPGGGPFIEAYIAPDMYMRPVSHTIGFLENAGFEVRDVEAMREHYVRTVRDWLATFEQRYDEIVALVGVEVARVWRLYLVGGALSFEEGRMGVDQILAVRNTHLGFSAMPPARPCAAKCGQ